MKRFLFSSLLMILFTVSSASARSSESSIGAGAPSQAVSEKPDTPAAPQSVQAKPVPVPDDAQGAESFWDVDASHPYHRAINELQHLGAVQGYRDDKVEGEGMLLYFMPEKPVSRAEFLAMMMKAKKLGKSAGRCFKDMVNQATVPYVCQAKKLGIIGGYSDGTFRPGQSVNYAEAAVMVAKVFDLPLWSSTGLWYEPAARVISERRAVPDSVQHFSQVLTRGQAAELLWRMKNDIQNKPSPTFKSLQQGEENKPRFMVLNDARMIGGHALNGKGQAVSRGVFWANLDSGEKVSLGKMAGQDVTPAAVNDQGMVVGSGDLTEDSDGGQQAFVWQKGVLLPLGSFYGPDGGSQAMDVNNRGQVVGWSAAKGSFPDSKTHAFLWEKGIMRNIHPAASYSSMATAANGKGRFVGYTSGENGGSTAVSWKSGRAKPLGVPTGGSSYATDINEQDQVVGYAHTEDTGVFYAFLWENGKTTDLGLEEATANAINNKGFVVGKFMEDGKEKPFLWHEGEALDLSLLAPWAGLTEAVDINDEGVVAFSNGSVLTLPENLPAQLSFSNPEYVELEGNTVVLEWQDSDFDNNAKISLFTQALDSDQDDPVTITTNLSEDADGTADRYEWDISGLPDGSYDVFAALEDGVNIAQVVHHVISFYRKQP